MIVLIIIPAVLISIFVIALLAFHVYLISIGKSTKEYIKINNKPAAMEPNGDHMTSKLESGRKLEHILVEDWGQQSPLESKKPYLVFSMPLTTLEAEYLSKFEMCL